MHLAFLDLNEHTGLDIASVQLSREEQQRAASIQRPKRRLQFLAGRRLARQMLEQHYGHASWQLTAEYGLPVRIIGHAHLHLSISHSENWVACALADFHIGIDIEVIKESRSALEIAELACSDNEKNALAQLSDARERQQLFYQFWTLKEAWLKMHGTPFTLAQLRILDAIPCANNVANSISWIEPGNKLAIALATPNGKLAHNRLCSTTPIRYWHIDKPG